MKDSDVMSIDIIAATENVSAIEAATRIEYVAEIRKNAKSEEDRNNCSKKYWY